MSTKTKFRKVLTPEFRVSFPQVFTASRYQNNPNAEPFFSITMLFPKKTTDMKEIQNAMKECAQEAFPGVAKNDLKLPLLDGDNPAHFKSMRDEYKGHWVLRAKTKNRPGIVQPDGQTYINDPGAFYAGCWARATINPFAYTTNGKGISFGLQNIQKLRDDDSFVARSKAEDDFEPVEGGADDPSNYPADDNDDWG